LDDGIAMPDVLFRAEQPTPQGDLEFNDGQPYHSGCERLSLPESLRPVTAKLLE
jgi:hypothetical protein